MNTRVLFLTTGLFFAAGLQAQQFISKALIEYEVKSNIKKTMGNGAFEEMLQESLPQFKTAYFTFIFANNKSVYRFDRWSPGPKLPEWLRKSDEENVWYFDHNTGIVNMHKNVWGSGFNVEDSIPSLQWKLIPNENRMIAGFNCRKAVSKIFDSVYVFVFYTDEITISGGPCSINGLPGMIMGVTIPRLFTSWIATKVVLNGLDENVIKPVAVKKNYSIKSLKSTLDERTKDWYDGGDNPEELKQQKNRFIWGTLL